MRYTLAAILLGAIIVIACKKTPPPPAPTPTPTPTPDPQPVVAGMNATELARWYHLSQGSELYPYRFLQALYLVDEQKPFIENLGRYGLIPDAVSEQNPEGMPVGVTVAPTKDLNFAGVRMVGINCAACHTTVMEKDGQVVLRADGGQNLFDIRAFLGALAVNTSKTFNSPLELLRFTSRLIGTYSGAQPRSHPFTTRLVDEGGDKLLRGITTLEEFKTRGPVEKQIAEDVEKLIDAELKKDPPPDPRKTLRTKTPEPNLGDLNDYSSKADKFFGSVKWGDPAKLKAQAGALKVKVLGDAKAQVKMYDDLAKVQPGAGSPLKDLSEAQRQAELRAGVTNILETLRLLRARFEFLKALSGGAQADTTAPLPGRVDAFGAARNTMFPNTPVPLTAPVNFPYLWNITQIPWYHWDNNTTSELQRNVGEAIGVGAIYTDDFSSTVRVDHIIELEQLAGKLKPPAWPAALGAIDQAKAARGKAHYDARCASCHQEPNPAGKFADKMYPLAKIGTDPLRAKNFDLDMGAGKFVDGLEPLLKNVIEKNGGPPQPNNKVWRTTVQYGARPLSAIWASAPYLHNGSVPTIHDLLRPEAERPKTFKVGIREYDPQKLGYRIEGTSPMVQVFDVTKAGNSNVGHSGPEFGTDLTDEQRYELLEYLKTR